MSQARFVPCRSQRKDVGKDWNGHQDCRRERLRDRTRRKRGVGRSRDCPVRGRILLCSRRSVLHAATRDRRVPREIRSGRSADLLPRRGPRRTRRSHRTLGDPTKVTWRSCHVHLQVPFCGRITNAARYSPCPPRSIRARDFCQECQDSGGGRKLRRGYHSSTPE